MKKIVIVEDEAITALNIRFVIEKAGYSVIDVVDSGEEAVDRALKKDVDLMLMDIMLSGAMTGIEAVREIRKCRNIPIVYMTAHSDQLTMNEAKETMPYGYIIKPFNHVEVCYTIDLALYKFEMESRLREKNEQLELRNTQYSDTILELERMNEELTSTNEEFERMNEELVESQTALAKSQVRYHSLFEKMIDAYALHRIIPDKEGRAADYLYVDINPAFSAITGKGREIIGKTIREVYPDSEENWVDLYDQLISNRKPERFTFYNELFKKWFEGVAFSPSKHYFAVIFSDITERVERENEIRQVSMVLERSKIELDALNEISFAETEISVLDELLTSAANSLARCVGTKDKASCSIIRGSHNVHSDNYAKYGVIHSLPLVCSGKNIGSVEISTPEKEILEDKETGKFIGAVVGRLGRIIERQCLIDESRAWRSMVPPSALVFSISGDDSAQPVNCGAAEFAKKKIPLERLVESYKGSPLARAMKEESSTTFEVVILPKKRGGRFMCTLSLPWQDVDGSVKRYLYCERSCAQDHTPE